MGWKLNIPKIFHVYWGGGVMPYMRFLTVKSFMKQNPDWKIMFWHPKYPTRNITWQTGKLNYEVNCNNYFNKMFELPIETNEVDFNKIGFSNQATEVHKSDFIRLHLLTTYGGVWSDMDILYFKSINSLGINVPENKDVETVVCISSYGHSTGFLMSQIGGKFFNEMLSTVKNRPLPQAYQAIGPTLFNENYRDIEKLNNLSPAVNLGMESVYFFDASVIPKFLDKIYDPFPSESIGSHWYAGHRQWKNYFSATNGGQKNLTDNLIGNIIKKINEE